MKVLDTLKIVGATMLASFVAVIAVVVGAIVTLFLVVAGTVAGLVFRNRLREAMEKHPQHVVIDGEFEVVRDA